MRGFLILLGTFATIFFLYEMLKAGTGKAVSGSTLPATIPDSLVNNPNPFARPI